MKKILLILTAMSFALPVLSQIRIIGQIYDTGLDEPMSYVNVAIYKPGSDSPVTGAFTDDDGRFIMYVPAGSYTFKSSFIGYRDISVDFNVTDADANKDLGTLDMEEDSKVIEEIEVVGQTSGMRLDIDKRVFNADQNLVSEGASASELLENIPSVSVDGEGNISLRNSTSVEIWINGKPSGLSDTDKGDILEMIPAETIERVELITNPSAKYDPEGNAGIINIVLKRSDKAGYFGNVSAGIRYREGAAYPGGNLGTNFTYSRKKIDFNLNANVRSNRNDRSSYTDRETYNGADTTYLHRDNYRSNERVNGFMKLGLTYYMDSRNTFDFTTFGMIGRNWNSNDIYYTYMDNNRDTTSVDNRLTDGSGLNGFYAANLKYTHSFQKEVQELSFSADYFYRGRNSYSNYRTFGDAVENNYTYQLQTQEENNNTFDFQGDYFKIFDKNSKLEAGFKLNYAWTESFDHTYDSVFSTPALVENMTLYNPFNYFEQIYSVYGNYAGKYDWFSFQAGIRLEETVRNFESLVDMTTERTSDHRFDWFPSVYLSFALPGNNEIQVNYTRRIQRPRGRRINSYIDRSDPTNITQGNPLLLPEIGNVAEINYMKMWDKHTLTAGIFYRYTEDVIQRVKSMEGEVMYNTYANITYSQNVGVEVIAKNRLFENYLDLTSSVSAYYYQLGGNEQYDIDMTQSFSWNARVNANVKILRNLSAQATIFYESPRIVAQGSEDDSFGVDLAIKSSFLNDALSLSFSVRDLFNTRRRGGISTSYGSDFYQETVNTSSGRTWSLNLSYNFGNIRKNKKQ